MLFAVVPQYQDFLPEEVYIDKSFSYESVLGMDVSYGPFRLWTEADTYAYKAQEGVFFAPYSIDYRVGLELGHGPVTLGVEHNCLHPVEYTRSYSNGYAQNKTKFFAKIKLKEVL